MAYVSYSTGLTNEILKSGGHSFADIMANFHIRLFGGSRPTNSDATEGSIHLLPVSLSSGEFTPGNATNGLNYDVATAKVLAKKVGEVWSGVGTVDAASPGVVATWGRAYDNAVVTGASTTSKRFDFDVGTSGAYCILGNTLILEGSTYTLDLGTITGQ